MKTKTTSRGEAPGTPLLKTGNTSTTRNTSTPNSSTAKISSMNSDFMNFNIRLFNNKKDQAKPKEQHGQVKQDKPPINDSVSKFKKQCQINHLNSNYYKAKQIEKRSDSKNCSAFSSKQVYVNSSSKTPTNPNTSTSALSAHNRIKRDFGFYKNYVNQTKKYRQSYYNVHGNANGNNRDKSANEKKTNNFSNFSSNGRFKIVQRYSNYAQLEK